MPKYLSENGVSGTFWINYSLNSFHTWHLSLWGESLDLYIFVFLPSFSALWWPNIRPKMGFWNFLKKLLAQFISYLEFILIEWVSWPLYILVFLVSCSALWWPNIWPKMGFSEILIKLLAQLIFVWRIPTCVAHDYNIEIFIGYFWMRWVLIRAGVYRPHLWAQLVSVWLTGYDCAHRYRYLNLSECMGSNG